MRSMVFVSLGLAAGIMWTQGAVAQNVPSTTAERVANTTAIVAFDRRKAFSPAGADRTSTADAKGLPPDVLREEQSGKPASQ